MKDMDFPRSLNGPTWKKYLDRELTYEERFILQDTKSEKVFNLELENLHEHAVKNGLHISELTKLHGNCLFESIIHHKIGTSVDMLRESLANIMYIFADYKGFFGTQEESIRDLFAIGNDIEYVFCSTEKCFYKYTFEVMCQDFSNDNSWTRLLTEVILMIISTLFNVNIIILHNNGHSTRINTNKSDSNALPVFLGLIGESHYVPLNRITDENHLSVPKYMDGQIRFFTWASKMWEKKNNKSREDSDEHKKNMKKYRNMHVDSDTFTSVNVPTNIANGVSFS